MSGAIETRKKELQAKLAASADGILESMAREQGLSLLDVVECLPQTMWSAAPGSHFVEVMQELATWGEMTVIVHTQDVIMEFVGPVPNGRVGGGFYNFQGSKGLTGHLYADHCAKIVFLRRPFMKKATAAVVFFNGEGACMFKVYVGRDENRELRADQLERFAALEAKLAGAGRLAS